VNWSATSPGGSRVSLNRLEVLKRVDSASPALFQRVATGLPLPSMELFVKKGGTTGPGYLRYRFTSAFVTSVSPSGDSEAMQERVTFEYASLAQRYQQPDAAGNPAGTVFEAGWNQLANMACTYGTCERITP
jgi:type VI protein secretion system component Hcp